VPRLRPRARRYPSASEPAADIRRHLANQPVTAGPPSAVYRTAKFVRQTFIAACAFAHAAAALATTRLGALPSLPARAAVDALFQPPVTGGGE
jgi:eukaryotic-like serine/threonine-protein kinase